MFLPRRKLHTLAQKILFCIRLALAHHRHLIRLGIEDESDLAVIAYLNALPVTDGHGKLSQCVRNGIHSQSLFRHLLLSLGIGLESRQMDSTALLIKNPSK